MRGMGGVSGRIFEQRIEDGRERLELNNPGKHRAIPDFGIENERGALRHLERVEFRCRCSNARFDRRRLRALEQFLPVDLARVRANLRGDVPLGDLFSFAQCGMRQRETNAVIGNFEILGRFRDTIRAPRYSRPNLDRTTRCST